MERRRRLIKYLKKLITIGFVGMLLVSCSGDNGDSKEKLTGKKNVEIQEKAKKMEDELQETPIVSLANDFGYEDRDGKMSVRGTVNLPKGQSGDSFNLAIIMSPDGNSENAGYMGVIEIDGKESYDFEFFVEEGEYQMCYYNYNAKGLSKYRFGEYTGIKVNDEDVEGTITLPEGEVAGTGGIDIKVPKRTAKTL